MKRTFDHLDGLYLHERCLLIDAIVKDQLRKQSAAEIEKLNREKEARNKRKRGTSNPSQNKYFL